MISKTNQEIDGMGRKALIDYIKRLEILYNKLESEINYNNLIGNKVCLHSEIEFSDDKSYCKQCKKEVRTILPIK